MCGLVGIIISAQNGGVWKDAEAFEQMLYFDALRGEDSTGIGMFTNEGGLRLTKGAMDANAFIKSTEWASVRADWISRGKAMIGHNRKKTIGEVRDDTAHPFLIDQRYLFMHNGTLSGHKHLADTEVDSEALGIHLTKCNGDVTKLEEALGKVWGAYACAWIDKEKQMLYLLRNKERPLYYGKFDGGWAFCSEPGFLQLALMRPGFKIKGDDIQSVPEHSLVSFDLTTYNVSPKTEVLIPKKHTTTTQQLPVVSATSGGQDNGGSVSKSAFKRFSKNGLQGRKISFQIEDYVEKFPGEGDKCTTWHLYSKSPDVAFDHVIHHMGTEMTKDELEDFYIDMVWEGVITGMSYNQKQKLVDIYVGKVELDFERKYPSGNVEQQGATVH